MWVITFLSFVVENLSLAPSIISLKPNFNISKIILIVCLSEAGFMHSNPLLALQFSSLRKLIVHYSLSSIIENLTSLLSEIDILSHSCLSYSTSSRMSSIIYVLIYKTSTTSFGSLSAMNGKLPSERVIAVSNIWSYCLASPIPLLHSRLMPMIIPMISLISSILFI
jgi:hypothetical protein